MEMTMNSFERIDEYIHLEHEKEENESGESQDPSWPSHGQVRFDNVSVRYAPDQPAVLHNLSFTISPNEKVAIVGRTGAGKTTISIALFRMLPLSDGSIFIDGTDISQMSKSDLRSRLTIIPQDPTLFRGTIRSNLDPFGSFDDKSIWDSIKRAGLLGYSSDSSSDMVSKLLSLDDPVSENGENYSQGQRQLICLSRAILRQGKIVFLDEATASTDYETDACIQRTIRQEFANSTVICIAHRLRTVMDYDKVLVLGEGKLLEYGSPLELLEKSEVGAFRNMCRETGEYEALMDLARKGDALKRES
jgi:ABC-type multidrug transport system fused ATPase/permease subunit